MALGSSATPTKAPPRAMALHPISVLFHPPAQRLEKTKKMKKRKMKALFDISSSFQGSWIFAVY